MLKVETTICSSWSVTILRQHHHYFILYIYILFIMKKNLTLGKSNMEPQHPTWRIFPGDFFGKSPCSGTPNAKPWKASTVATLVKVIPPQRIHLGNPGGHPLWPKVNLMVFSAWCLTIFSAYPGWNKIVDRLFCFFEGTQVPRSHMVLPLSPCLIIMILFNFHFSPHHSHDSSAFISILMIH